MAGHGQPPSALPGRSLESEEPSVGRGMQQTTLDSSVQQSENLSISRPDLQPRAQSDPSAQSPQHHHVRFSFESAEDVGQRHHADPSQTRINKRTPDLYIIPSNDVVLGDRDMTEPTSRPVLHASDDGRATFRTSNGPGNSFQESHAKFRQPSTAQRRRLATKAKLPNKIHSVQNWASNAVQKYIIEGLFRQRPLKPSVDGRHIPLGRPLEKAEPLIDERTNKPYVSNFIRSSRYTLWDFLPKQLIFQFSKLANFYFLVMGIMQLIPGLSTTGSFTTIVPLSFFVSFSIGKEGYDDYRRYRLDRIENRSFSSVLNAQDRAIKVNGKPKQRGQEDLGGERGGDPRSGKTTADPLSLWATLHWQDIRVGDVIRLRRDENVPADIVLLHASGPDGTAYIETMALDGETNLKSKQACPSLEERCAAVEGLRVCDVEVVSEDPNLDLYNYDGRVTVKGETYPLSLNNIVYRGSIVRNTAEVFGLVVNSGEECKIRMNANKNVRAKAPAMQAIVNRIVLFLVFLVLSLASGLTAGYFLWKEKFQRHAFYLYGAALPFKEVFVAYIIMFNTLIPLSLYVSLEIVKIGQLFLIQDVEMYDPVSDTPMVANTTTILENLGQISYVFSDKTGTLTENLMRFRKMSVAGTAWLHDMDVERDQEARARKMQEVLRRKASKGKQGSFSLRRASGAFSVSRWSSTARRRGVPMELKTEDLLNYLEYNPNSTFSRKARQFFLCLALCHTCIPEENATGNIQYQAASPDELALVEAAKDLGFLLVDRSTHTIKLQFEDESGTQVSETYQVLDVIEFNSQRKRMSIIVRMPDGRVCIFCKGADSAIMPRLKLRDVAMQKARAIERRASKRKSMEQDLALRRMSIASRRASLDIAHAASTAFHMHALGRRGSRRSGDILRRNSALANEVDSWLTDRETQEMASPIADESAYQTPRQSLAFSPRGLWDSLVDEELASDDGAIFERCFQHVDDFASEGLRTLLYGYRYLDEDEYASWRRIYQEATTSLVDRQEKIDRAGELIEQNFDLAGATAIEDKLQDGVPDTIDKLRRANIKIWMLTGDKRETAINIGHSARICKPFSEIYVLDSEAGNLRDKMVASLNDVSRGMIPHSVLVVDGATLAAIEDDEDLGCLFRDLAIRVDSVICCRASPSQKANLVRAVRHEVDGAMTLAIGDGANDIGMIQASHVGIGISGREGLQAARISDYSIAQFRFLQRLLFVHGRWNYIRTGKYVLATFWKEIVFFLVQAHFQRHNAYTGTSLFENWSLTVFNSFFTSLPVILLGMFEKDLQAATLLAVPELYTFGQRNMGFNFPKYIGWMVMGVIESVIVFYFVYSEYSDLLNSQDTTLYAIGSCCFTVSVLFINIKLLVLELHNKTFLSFIGLLISVVGWFVWNIFLAAVYPNKQTLYFVHHAFLKNFGRDPTWWITIVLTLSTVVILELMVSAFRRVYFPNDQDIMQRVERERGMRSVMREHATEAGEAGERGGEASSPVSKVAVAVAAARRSLNLSLHTGTGKRGVGDELSLSRGESSPLRRQSGDFESGGYRLQDMAPRRPADSLGAGESREGLPPAAAEFGRDDGLVGGGHHHLGDFVESPTATEPSHMMR